MLKDHKVGQDEKEDTWFAEPNYAFKMYIGDELAKMTGTFRHVKCTRAAPEGTFVANMCYNCRTVPNLKSFRKRALKRNNKMDHNARGPTTNFQNMNHDEMLSKLREMREEIKSRDSQLFFLTSEIARLKIRVRTTKEKLKEFARRGDMKGIAHKLQMAAEQGLFKDQGTLFDLLDTVSRNLHVKKQGRRYKASVEQFMEVILIWGGPRLADFVSQNLLGPHLHTIYKWRQQKQPHVKPGLYEQNFVELSEIYKKAKQRLELNQDVPVLICEDETAIINDITWDQRSDRLFGFCGKDGEDHKCMHDCELTVGDDDGAYNKLVSTFQTFKKGTSARVMMINPLHKDLPRLPVMLMCTCNKFDSEFVQEQWRRVDELYEKHLKPVLGPKIGNSSDGDARRRKAMLNRSRSSSKESVLQPVPVQLGFIFNTTKNLMENGYQVHYLNDQDAIHNHKKLINPLDHATRSLMLGENLLIHINHLEQVRKTFSLYEHGITKDDIMRQDRQNWKCAQKLSCKKILDCLKKLENMGHACVKGTRVYLYLVWNYAEIFFSKDASLARRVQNAAYIVHFLGIWNNFIRQHKNLQLKSNFISRETFLDTLLSAHFAVLYIVYHRDNHPELPCQLDVTGSEPCEVLFSQFGQWVGNRRTYRFGEMLANVSSMFRLEHIRSDPDGPKFKRGHEKQENIWPKLNGHNNKADLTEYPSDNEVLKSWKAGIQEARASAVEVGMFPSNFLQR
jgi:hypothetical protein